MRTTWQRMGPFTSIPRLVAALGGMPPRCKLAPRVCFIRAPLKDGQFQMEKCRRHCDGGPPGVPAIREGLWDPATEPSLITADFTSPCATWGVSSPGRIGPSPTQAHGQASPRLPQSHRPAFRVSERHRVCRAFSPSRSPIAAALTVGGTVVCGAGEDYYLDEAGGRIVVVEAKAESPAAGCGPLAHSHGLAPCGAAFSGSVLFTC
jgi:hypothetical protein